MLTRLTLYVCLLIGFTSVLAIAQDILFEDDFSAIRRGPYSVQVGAHTEYHYLHEAAPRGNWQVSTFASNLDFMRAWQVRHEGSNAVMVQTFTNTRRKHTHPMLVAGDSLWQDYTLEVTFAPDSDKQQSGIIFRYLNDRCYYFFGLQDKQVVLKMVRHATAFHQPFEKILTSADYDWHPGQYVTAVVHTDGERITAELEDKVKLTATDTTYTKGRIALMSDAPARFAYVKVTASHQEVDRYHEIKLLREQELTQRMAANPKPALWKKIQVSGFGAGRNLRFGDLNNDGQIDVLIGQVHHHGPKDRNSELSCLTAMTFDGEMLWQIGTPDPWKTDLTNDVAFQIHDLDGDGKNEVIYTMNLQLMVADGATGKVKYQAPTPESPPKAPGSRDPHNMFDRILGDCLYFCDLRGTGRDADIIIKDRYSTLWALNDKLKLLWQAKCRTGHYPFAYDIDADGRDELMLGYTLFDENGTKLWSLDEQLNDHADGVAIVQYHQDSDPVLMCAASDEGLFFADLNGQVLKHHYIGHGQNPAVANFRDDLPGLETVSINFWGNQGILTYYDADGDIYQQVEPNQYGSMCLPVNWTGRSEEYIVHNANVDEGGLYDGWGRKVVDFPDDGHPDMCNAVLDIAGDCRDEIVVWDPNEIWVYTQNDGAMTGSIYYPRRNSLYNYSNYQATVSLPGWQQP